MAIRLLSACLMIAVGIHCRSVRGDSTLQSQLTTHCVDCHSAGHNEADVLLDGFDTLSAAKKEDLLNRIEEQLYLGMMPPEQQPGFGTEQREQMLVLVSNGFSTLGVPSSFREKLKSPNYGNYVNHDRLFSGEIEDLPWSPARLWRTSPYVFDNTKSELGGKPKELRQPFIVDDKQGIRDYAALLFADSAVVNVLMTNAGDSADELVERNPEFRRLAENTDSPDELALSKSLQNHFRKVVYRDPTDVELQRYVDLFRESAAESDNAEALRVTLMAIMLHHESVYRIEIGLGEAQADGRRMLSPTELAFSIAFALTDRRPDEELLNAVMTGQLSTREDVRTQVQRILQDVEINKPRILRFFQEFFGYTQAHKVFKDAARSGGFSYYGENYPNMYERDADFFVMDILEDDRDVFRRLLTSDEYYILNRQTFRNTVFDFYQHNKDDLDKDVFPPEKEQELLERLDLRSWKELNAKYHLHNFNRGFRGNAAAIRQIVKEVHQWKNTDDEQKLLYGMQPLYKKYPMVYDLADDEQDFLLPQPYKRPNRAGMLTHPAWLIAHSLNDSTDPIRRGKWVRERLLAGTVPDLPITVDATVPEDHSKTLRERLVVTEQQECWRCHERMNPLGYAFEIYDDFGRYRTEETLDKLPAVKGVHPTKPVVAASFLQGTGDPDLDGEITDALDMIDRLARSDRVRQSMVRHAFRYFMGRNEMLTDSKTLIAADQAYSESGGSFRALLTSLLTSDSFLYRK